MFRSENPPGIVSRGGLVSGLGRDDLTRLLRGPRWCQTDPRGTGLFRCRESKTYLDEYCRRVQKSSLTMNAETF